MLQRFNSSRNRAHSEGETSQKVTSPLLAKKDIDFLARSSSKLSQRDILKMHVKNWRDLDMKSRRRVMGHVQSQRAMHAKEVFLKELAAVGGAVKGKNNYRQR